VTHFSVKKLLSLLLVFLAVWLALRFVLPLLLPFFLGAILALAAEPGARFLSARLKLPRSIASIVSISAAIALFLGLLFFLASLLFREVGQLVQALPDVEGTARQGLLVLQDFLLSLAQRTPDSVQSLLTRLVLEIFSSGTALLDNLVRRVPAMLSGLLEKLPTGLLGVGTGLISGFMISARLPRLKQFLQEKLDSPWFRTARSVLQELRKGLGGWLKAQLKLAGTTFSIVCLGLVLLGIPYAPVWAVGIAMVDAIPVLGTGTVLLPWALIHALQGRYLQALALAGIYILCVLSRSVLEPRLVGKQLGLDPLVTLGALYAGFRIWGVGGMILAPMLAVAAMQLANLDARSA